MGVKVLIGLFRLPDEEHFRSTLRGQSGDGDECQCARVEPVGRRADYADYYGHADKAHYHSECLAHHEVGASAKRALAD